MKTKLTTNRKEYLYYHLNQHIEISGLKKYFCYEKGSNKVKEPYILFPLSDMDISISFTIDNLPVLFPLSDRKIHYYFDKKNNLIFEHDLLKSAFYLLSGFQETQPFEGDHLKRFSYHDSIQKKLKIADRPVVNEYFYIIKKALILFCNVHKIEVTEKKIWGEKDFGVFLTHDVDRVDKSIFAEIKNSLKAITLSRFSNWGYFFKAIKNFNFKNEYWNFEWLKNLEQKHSFNSTWFFLPKGHPEIDAHYSFSEKRIKELANYLISCGDEIALHGTYLSCQDEKVMLQNLNDVQTLTPEKITKSRQHWLSFKYPQTLRILEKLEIKYDSSWGFADHYGWRNSYCLPFHPYDIENETMMEITELPLSAMDVTFFDYMGLTLEEAFKSFEKIIKTCKRYNGLFVLLWHNSHFNETLLPGITKLYEDILQLVKKADPYLYR